MQLRQRPDGLIVLDDAYNANPESVRAALQALARLGAGRRTWAVLGPMRELGSGSLEMHRQVGAFAAEVGLDELVVVGADATPIADGAEQAGSWSGRARRVADATAATAVLVAEAGAGDAVLVKASNSERLWRVADVVVAQMDRASA
jgi:UDP-N-acetylmuramoyl-tripeptide--D-alanyl-D-alanine ligase